MTASDINEIKYSITKMLHKLDNLTTLYNAIEKSISFLSDKVDGFNIKLQSTVQTFNDNDIWLNTYENKIVNVEVKEENFKKIFQLRNKDDSNSRIEFINNEVM